MLPDEPTDEEREEELDQDNGTPFRPADDTSPAPAADDTHPASDTDVDSDELYQEGVTSATNAPDPDAPDRDLENVDEISTEDTEDESVGSPS